MINEKLTLGDNWTEFTKEQISIVKEYEKLKNTLPSSANIEDYKKLDKAFDFAVKSHAGMRRYSGEPYIMHPLRVALIVSKEIGLGLTSILAALIHDVVEDTSVSINDIKDIFGSTVCEIVHGLTKIKKLASWEEGIQGENFKKLFLEASKDSRIILLKLSDRLDNMRTLEFLPRRKQLRISGETRQFYAPLAHRLGLNRIKAELEDLFLKSTQPDIYYEIARMLQANLKNREFMIDKVAQPIKKELKLHGLKFRIEHRAKSIYSIWGKMNPGYDLFKEIYDLVALRIIVDCKKEDEKRLCWQTYGIITTIYPSIPSRLRDWISNPKINGYESLHATLMDPLEGWIEVQIRSERMHKIAERGVAAHWEYKWDDATIGKKSPRLYEWFLEVRKLLEQGRTMHKDLMDDVKMSLYDDEISVFTHEGQLKVLPKGATVLDFSVDVFGEKGLKCSGAIINNELIPPTQSLKNATKLLIIISIEQKIDRKWLQKLKTPKARRLLREHFSRLDSESVRAGKDELLPLFNKHFIQLNKSTESYLKAILNERDIENIYYKIAKKIIPIELIESSIQTIAKQRDNKFSSKSILEENLSAYRNVPIKLQLNKQLVITQAIHPKYTFSKCCCPIPNEEIFGIFYTNKPIEIHHVHCINSSDLLSTKGARIIKARWNPKGEEGFPIYLNIKAINRKSMTRDIVNTIKDEAHIESLSFVEEEDSIIGNLIIDVYNTNNFKHILKLLSKIKGVLLVKRLHSPSNKKA